MRQILLATLITVGTIQAQTITDNSIELSISDTLPVRTKQIIYDFTPQGTEMGTDAVYEEDTDWAKLQKKVAEESKKLCAKLTKDLQKEGFKVSEVPNEEGYNISTYDEESENSGVRITVADEKELKRLVTYLRANAKGDGSVSTWEREPGAVDQQQIMTSLFTKAEAQARTLAELGGRKLGPLIHVHDPESPTMGNSIVDMFIDLVKQEMMKKNQWKLPYGNTKTLVFRFALLDK